jgi:hypothetical protein
MSMHHATLDSLPLPSPSQIADLRLAASNMTGDVAILFRTHGHSFLLRGVCDEYANDEKVSC